MFYEVTALLFFAVLLFNMTAAAAVAGTVCSLSFGQIPIVVASVAFFFFFLLIAVVFVTA